MAVMCPNDRFLSRLGVEQLAQSLEHVGVAAIPAVLARIKDRAVISFGPSNQPRVTGSVLSISPVIVLFAVLFWSYVWGVFGAFIGVPIAIAFLTFCAQHPSSAWLAELFGSSENDVPSLKT